jgi:hypothetical protein
MALTPAEKQKRYRDRQKEKLAQAGDPTDAIASEKFSDWMGVEWSAVEYALDWAGLEVPDFEAMGDTDPYWQQQHDEGYEKDPNRGSIGRSERMVDQLFEAAGHLAAKINEYKREQVAARIAQIETMDLSDLAVRKDALAELAKLNKLSERLNKKARYEVPTYRLKGE